MQEDKLITNSQKSKVNFFVGDFYIDSKAVINGNIESDEVVIDYLMTKASKKKALDSLKMVQFDKSINSRISSLSINDRKKIELAFCLCSKSKILIFQSFEKGFNYREKNYFKKLFKKLTTYDITIIINSNDMTFMFDVSDSICLVKENKVVKILDGKDYYNKELINYIEPAKIVEFINKCNYNGLNIDHYNDIKELMKALYRMVG